LEGIGRRDGSRVEYKWLGIPIVLLLSKTHARLKFLKAVLTFWKMRTASSSSSSSSSSSTLDFDEEARKLWARLNIDEPQHQGRMWNPLDPIFKHKSGGGTIYVGNQTAAENLTMLQAHGITHVVNCTHGFSKIPNFHPTVLQYYTFPISHWMENVNQTNASVINFVAPLFQFIDDAISSGKSVLVHCLAGAHRAGTTGCACLIYYAELDVPSAIKTAKKLRSVIDPIGQLPEFLHRLKRALDAVKSTSKGVIVGAAGSMHSAHLQQSPKGGSGKESGDRSNNTVFDQGLSDEQIEALGKKALATDKS